MTSSPKKKEQSRSLLYRILAWLHLWLGLVTGIIVFIVCLTGCIWVFNDEIKLLTESEFNIPKQDKPLIKPSTLVSQFKEKYPDKSISFITYKQDQAITVNIGERKRGATGGYTARVNPYTGEVINIEERKPGQTDFFRFILNGHRFLWLPFEIGRPIVNYSVLMFVIILISGLVLWWPKNKAATKQRVWFKWKESTQWKRKNYDLHNILGFYSMLFLLAIALTGMVWGIEWYNKGLYWVTSAGRTMPEHRDVVSDTLAPKQYSPKTALDSAWNLVLAKHPYAAGFSVSPASPKKAKSVIRITAYPEKGQFYNAHGYIFDQHTLSLLPGNPVFDKTIQESDFAGSLRKMNYDIHVGSILGFPGKVLAFLSSLIGASLPITGFYIWWGKKKKEKKKSPQKPERLETSKKPLSSKPKFQVSASNFL